jgi:hypothetical protein
MAINSELSFDVGKNGFGIKDDDDNIIAYYTSDSGSPVGQAAPVPTYYLDTTNAQPWIKYGPGNNDWKRLPRNDSNFPFTCFDFGRFLTERNFGARNTGVQTYTTVPSTINFNLIDPSSDSVAYRASSGNIEFQQDIDCYVDFQVGSLLTVASGIMVYSLEISTGGGAFVAVPGSLIAQEFTLVGGLAFHSPSREVRINALKGDIIRVRANLLAPGPLAQSFGGANIINIKPAVVGPTSENGIDCGTVDSFDENEKIRLIDAGEL